jgi:hypothetical protein
MMDLADLIKTGPHHPAAAAKTRFYFVFVRYLTKCLHPVQINMSHDHVYAQNDM